jgi:hypothetical protein
VFINPGYVMPNLKSFAALVAPALALSLAATAAPASAATVLFASYNTGASNDNNFRFDSSGDDATMFTVANPGDTTAGAAAVFFTFMGDPALSGFVNLAADFTLNATVTDTPGGFDGATFAQTGVSNGDFSFVYSGPTTDINGYHLVQDSTVLFSGTFDNAWIQGNGGVGGLAVTLANGGSANFHSDFYDLSNFVPATEEYTFHLGSVTPDFGQSDPNNALNSFTGHLGGEFQGQIAAVVPEPAAWALMIVGFGAAGAAMRRRRSLALA